MQTTEIATWTEKMARQVLTGADLDAFLALPLRSQVAGIAVFAKLADDQKARDAAIAAAGILDAAARDVA